MDHSLARGGYLLWIRSPPWRNTLRPERIRTWRSEENRCPGRRCPQDASCDLGEEGACERVPGPRSRNNISIKAEVAPITLNRKDQLQQEQEKYVHGHSRAAL
jgi:hypothetical protein